jgi:hypothetical protein
VVTRDQMFDGLEAEFRKRFPKGPATARLLAGDALLWIEENILNVPETRAFADAVVLEAQHQQQRWGTEHDAGKTDGDWFWLVGYLAGKALHNPGVTPRDASDKKLHRIITVAAACANWHSHVLDPRTPSMRPGIAPPPGEEATP